MTEPIYLTYQMASEYLHIAPSTLRQMVFKRKIPHTKPCGKVLFIKSELDAWIESSKRPVTT